MQLWKFSIETNSWILYKVASYYFVSMSVFPSLLGQILFNFYSFGQFSTAHRQSCWKISKIEILGATWAGRLQNEKRKGFCGTPCTNLQIVKFWEICVNQYISIFENLAGNTKLVKICYLNRLDSSQEIWMINYKKLTIKLLVFGKSLQLYMFFCLRMFKSKSKKIYESRFF